MKMGKERTMKRTTGVLTESCHAAVQATLFQAMRDILRPQIQHEVLLDSDSFK